MGMDSLEEHQNCDLNRSLLIIKTRKLNSTHGDNKLEKLIRGK